MAQSLISIITLATLAFASPLAKRQSGACGSGLQWTSQAGDTCDSIGGLFGIPGSAILSFNSYLDCNDIWVDTPVCILYSSALHGSLGACTSKITSVAGDTCTSIGATYDLLGWEVWYANQFLNCNDIWPGTPVCIPTQSNENLPVLPTGPPTVITSNVVVHEASTTTSSCVQTYWSKAGDNCDSIGATFGLTGDAIWNANTFLNCADIWVNTPVCIPRQQPIVVTRSVAYETTFQPIPTPTQPIVCKSTYWSKQGDNCDTIGAAFDLFANDILGANSFLNCSDIWFNTPICIPVKPVDVPSPSSAQPTTTTTPSACQSTYISVAGDTCDSIGAQFGLAGNDIWSSNQFLTCTDIWPWTPVCIPLASVQELATTSVAPTDDKVVYETFPTVTSTTSDLPTVTSTTSDLPTSTSTTSDVVSTDSTTISDVYVVDSTTSAEVYVVDSTSTDDVYVVPSTTSGEIDAVPTTSAEVYVVATTTSAEEYVVPSSSIAEEYVVPN